MSVRSNVPVPTASEPSVIVAALPGTTSSELVDCPLPIAVLETPATVKFQVSLPVPPTTVLAARTLPGGIRFTVAVSSSDTVVEPTLPVAVAVLTSGSVSFAVYWRLHRKTQRSPASNDVGVASAAVALACVGCSLSLASIVGLLHVSSLTSAGPNATVPAVSWKIVSVPVFETAMR